MNKIRHIANLNQIELDNRTPFSASWHQQYANSSAIYIGGLPLELVEGDIIQIFSQYGEIVDMELIRDADTGKSRGFCFLWYENQKSTVLAVDNFNGILILGKLITVNHHVQNKNKIKRKDETAIELEDRIKERRRLVLEPVVKKRKKEKKGEKLDVDDPMAEYFRKKRKSKKD
jgi:RNA-binding motif protein, X-linked 2